MLCFHERCIEYWSKCFFYVFVRITAPRGCLHESGPFFCDLFSVYMSLTCNPVHIHIQYGLNSGWLRGCLDAHQISHVNKIHSYVQLKNHFKVVYNGMNLIFDLTTVDCDLAYEMKHMR